MTDSSNDQVLQELKRLEQKLGERFDGLKDELNDLRQDVRRTEQGLNSLRSAQSYWPRLQDEVRMGAFGDRLAERRSRYVPLYSSDQD